MLLCKILFSYLSIYFLIWLNRWKLKEIFFIFNIVACEISCIWSYFLLCEWVLNSDLIFMHCHYRLLLSIFIHHKFQEILIIFFEKFLIHFHINLFKWVLFKIHKSVTFCVKFRFESLVIQSSFIYIFIISNVVHLLFAYCIQNIVTFQMFLQNHIIDFPFSYNWISRYIFCKNCILWFFIYLFNIILI